MREWDCYAFSPYPQWNDDVSFELLIQHWAGEDHFKPICWIDGEWYEVITREERQQRVEDVREHEGDEVARLFNEGEDRFHVVRKDHPIFAARERWEAMMKLGLFTLSAGLKDLPSKPLSEELRKRMDEAREREWLNSVE